MSTFHSTTILCVRRDAGLAMAGDGQVTIGATVAKSDAVKVRRLNGLGAKSQGVLVGFAGSAADSFALLERFEAKLKDTPTNLTRAAIELAKTWRTDRALRRLEALLVVADLQHTLLLSGTGDLIEPDDDLVAIGSGGGAALAAARALMRHTALGAADVAVEALRIAAEIDIYTNDRIVCESLTG